MRPRRTARSAWLRSKFSMTDGLQHLLHPLMPPAMSDAPTTIRQSPTTARPSSCRSTDFPMKAGLPQKEPLILAKWQEADLYGQLRAARDGREKFIFHDGPPYANGDIHIGHALNHILKDMVVRTQTLLGKDAPYVPGWDCHGLPIEWKVEEQYRKKKLNKDEVPVKEFRAECRAYAQHWVDVQREQLKRLGIGGQLGQALPHHELRGGGDHRLRTVQVRRKRPALPRRQAGDVVAGREDRAGRGRDRI